MDGTLKIREARCDDAEAIVELFSDLNYQIYSKDEFKRIFKDMTEDKNTWGLYVADISDRPVGFVSVNIRGCLRLEGIMASIEELVVKRELRNTGIGSKLLKKAIDFADMHLCKRIEVLTSTWRESYKRGFYLKNGFSEHDSAVFRINK